MLENVVPGLIKSIGIMEDELKRENSGVFDTSTGNDSSEKQNQIQAAEFKSSE